MTAAARRPAKPLPPPMTADEFFALPDDGAGTKYELVDGYLVAMAPALPIHNQLQATLAYLVRRHLEATRSLCWVGTETGVQPKMQGKFNVKIPDLGVSCTPLSLTDKTLRDPVLLVEILSPSNAKATRASVWLYASIPTVREILLVHTTDAKVELFQRQSDGSWATDASIAVTGNTAHLSCIDMPLAVDELYRGTPLAQPA